MSRAISWFGLTSLLALPIILGRVTLGSFRMDGPVKWLALLLDLLALKAMLFAVRDFPCLCAGFPPFFSP